MCSGSARIEPYLNAFEKLKTVGKTRFVGIGTHEKRDLEIGDELGLTGFYCDQCGRCVAQCPAAMDIPTLKRSHMYAFGHRQPRKALDALRSWTYADVACAGCRECRVKCAHGFDVKSRALDIARVLEVPAEFLGFDYWTVDIPLPLEYNLAVPSRASAAAVPVPRSPISPIPGGGAMT